MPGADGDEGEPYIVVVGDDSSVTRGVSFSPSVASSTSSDGIEACRSLHFSLLTNACHQREGRHQAARSVTRSHPAHMVPHPTPPPRRHLSLLSHRGHARGGRRWKEIERLREEKREALLFFRWAEGKHCAPAIFSLFSPPPCSILLDSFLLFMVLPRIICIFCSRGEGLC